MLYDYEPNYPPPPHQNPRTTPGSRNFIRWGFLALMLAFFILPGKTFATPDVVTYLGASPWSGCTGDECCQHFRINFNTFTPDLYIELVPNSSSSSDGCIDEACWESQNQGVIPYLSVQMTHTGANTYKITFAPRLSSGSLDFYLCASNDCWKQFNFFKWHSTNGDLGAMQPLSLCYGEWPACGEGCDWVNAYNNYCYTDICYHHFDSGHITSVSLNFTPGLIPCNLGNSDPHYSPSPLCSFASSIKMDLAGWTYSYDPITHQLTFTANPGYDLGPCGTFCFSVPKCTSTQLLTITVTSGNGCPQGYSFSMKKSSGSSGEKPNITDGNYPNPLESSTGFRTTVPFSTTGATHVAIVITNETGQRVVADEMDASSAGRHFFYFTGALLPAGKYFYEIRTSDGGIVVKHSLLIVK
jgi:hypothetical protein